MSIKTQNPAVLAAARRKVISEAVNIWRAATHTRCDEALSARLMSDLLVPAGIKLILEDYAVNEVEVASFEVGNRGQGIGTQLLNSLVASADKFGVNLMLITAGDQQKQDRLATFYGRAGFEADGEVMRRRAKALTMDVRYGAATGLDEADIAFEAFLLSNQIIGEEDIVESFYWDSTDPTPGVVVKTDTEEIYIDKQGNITRGALE